MGTVQTITNLFTAPHTAFTTLQQRPSFLIPLLMILIAMVISVVWYYGQVDLVWLTERSLAAANQSIPDDARQQMLAQVGKTPTWLVGIGAAVGAAITLLIGVLISSGYLAIVSQVTNDGFRFKQWLCLCCWCSLPLVLSSLAIMVNLAINDISHLPAEQLDPLSIANLLGMHATHGVGVQWARSVNVTSLWCLGLVVAGYRYWTQKSLLSSILIIIVPVAAVSAVIAILAA